MFKTSHSLYWKTKKYTQSNYMFCYTLDTLFNFIDNLRISKNKLQAIDWLCNVLVSYNTRNLLKYHYTMYTFFASVWLLTGIFDPCTTNNILEHSKYRGGNCIARTGKEICDKYIDEQWYKTENNLTIATNIQKPYHCGTSFPIWLNGKLET